MSTIAKVVIHPSEGFFTEDEVTALLGTETDVSLWGRKTLGMIQSCDPMRDEEGRITHVIAIAELM